MNKNIFLLIIIITISSCGYNEGRFTISNESNFTIDSLYIMPDSRKKIIKISKGENVNHKIKMDEVKSDSCYFISFKNSKTSEIVSQGFGYYTNGYQTEEIINITILNDTILINSKFDNSY